MKFECKVNVDPAAIQAYEGIRNHVLVENNNKIVHKLEWLEKYIKAMTAPSERQRAIRAGYGR